LLATYRRLVNMLLFCSTALTSTEWVQMTTKPWHCPPFF